MNDRTRQCFVGDATNSLAGHREKPANSPDQAFFYGVDAWTPVPEG